MGALSSTTLTNQRRHLTTYHNQLRGSTRPTLVQNSTLNAMALGWATQMAQKNYFNNDACHTRPNGYNFFQWWNTKAPYAWRCSRTSCPYGMSCPYYIGENIARGYSNAADVFNAWKNSPSHYRNIMNRSYRHIGIGIYDSSGGKRYWAVLFFGDATGTS
jgi:uncharacterized protein YkwD